MKIPDVPLDDDNDVPGYQLTPLEREVSWKIIQCAIKVHRKLGPGLTEHVYEICLCHELKKLGLKAERQVDCPVVYDGVVFEDAFRIDVLVENLIICELKCADEISLLHRSQLKTYLRMMNLHVGMLLNFNSVLMKEGIRRIVIRREEQ